MSTLKKRFYDVMDWFFLTEEGALATYLLEMAALIGIGVIVGWLVWG